MHKSKVQTLPFVMNRDGILTKYHSISVRKIDIDIFTKINQ